MYLVEKEIYKTVELIFLVCGHTKNVCDSMFKQLKHKFHHKNIYTMHQLMNALHYSPKVHAVRAPSEVHFDWDALFDKIYKRPAAGTVNKNHIFRAELSVKAHLITERIKGVDVVVQNLSKVKPTSKASTRAGRTRQVRYGKPQVIKATGIKPIKQVDLYKKWGPLVPDEFREDICPKPCDRILKVVAEERATKQRAKVSKKGGKKGSKKNNRSKK